MNRTGKNGWVAHKGALMASGWLSIGTKTSQGKSVKFSFCLTSWEILQDWYRSRNTVILEGFDRTFLKAFLNAECFAEAF